MVPRPVPASEQGENTGLYVRKAKFLARLERRIGERKVDLLLEEPGDPRLIIEIAHRTGVRL